MEQNICLDEKINNTKRCKFLLKSIDRVYEEYPDISNFIDTSNEEICRGENVSHHHLFSICFGFLCCFLYCLHHNLWLAMFYNHKPKLKNDAFDYRFVT